MDEQYDELINGLVAAGASDDEIKAILAEEMAKTRPTTPAQPTTIMGGIENAFERGLATRDVAEVLNPHEDEQDPEAIAKLQQAVATQEANPGSEAYQEFTGANTFGGSLEAFAKDPLQILSELTTESLVPLFTHGAARLAAGTATGAALGSVIPGAGTAVGAGAGAIGALGSTSLNLEYSSSILESLREAGIDFTSMDSLVSGLKDEELMEKAKKHALLKGVPIAVFDMASAGVAGRLFSTPAKGLIKKGLRGAAEMGVQMGLGGAGELAGQVISGEEIQPGAIMAEVFGEVGGGAVEIATGSAFSKKQLAEEDEAVKAAEAIVAEDKSAVTGDPSIDDVIDKDYAELAKLLDEVDITEDVEPEKVEEQVTNDAAKDIFWEQVKAELDKQNAVDQSDVQFDAQTADYEDANAPQSALDMVENPDAEFYGESPAPIVPVQRPSPIVAPPTEPSPVTQEQIQAVPQELKPFLKNMGLTAGNFVKLPVSEQERILGLWFSRQKPAPVTEQPVVAEPAKVEPVVEAPVEAAAEAKPEVVAEKVAAPVKEPKQPRVKPPVDVKAKEERLNEKVDKMLDNIAKLKPGKRMKRLQELDEKTLDYPEVNKKVVAELDKFRGVQDEKEFAKQLKSATTKEKLDLIAARSQSENDSAAISEMQEAVASAEGVEDLNEVQKISDKFDEAYEKVRDSNGLLSIEQAEIEGIAKKAKAEFNKKLEPLHKAERAREQAQSADKRGRGKERDALLTEIARNVERGLSGQVDIAIKRFQEWRKSVGYETEMSKEEVLKKASADHYTRAAKTANIREREQDRKNKLNTVKSKIEEAKAAKEAAKREMGQELFDEFGLSDETEIDYLDNTFEGVEDEKFIKANFSNVRPITLDHLFKRIGVFYRDSPTYLKAITSLVELANKYIKKYTTKGLEIYIADRAGKKGTAGVHMYDPNTNREIMIISTDMDGDVDAHELLHMVTRAAILGMAGKTKTKFVSKAEKIQDATDEFYADLGQIYKGSVLKFRDELLQMVRDASNGKELTGKQINLLVLVQGYLESRNKSDFMNRPLTLEDVETIYTNTFGATTQQYRPHSLMYMFSNPDELLAEAFSNPWAAGILSQLESPTSTTSGGFVSYFRDLMNSLIDLIKTITKELGLDIKPVNNNYFSELTKFVSSVEADVLKNEQSGLDYSPTHLPDSMLERIRLRLSSLHLMAKANGPKLSKLTKAKIKVINAAGRTLWRNKNIKTEQDLQQIVDKINAAATGKAQIAPVETALIWQKIQKYRKELAEAKQLQSDAKVFASTQPEYEKSFAYRSQVNDFTSVDMDELPIAAVRKLKKGIVDLALGGIPAKAAYDIVNKDKAMKALKTLLPTQGKYATDPNIFSFKLADLANPATFASILAKYNTPVAQKLFNTIYGGMLEARSMAQKQANAFNDKMHDIVDKMNLNIADFTRAQMYGTAFTTGLSPTNPDYWGEVTENLDKIILDVLNKIKAIDKGVEKRTSREQAVAELHIAGELKKTILARKSMSGILTRGQQALYDTFREFIAEHETDAERNARGVWGDDTFNRLHNYTPLKALGRVRTGEFSEDDQLIANPKAQNLWESIFKHTNYGKIQTGQNGATKQRMKTKGIYYDNNIMSVANKYAAPLLFDIYATRDLKALNQLLHGATGNPVSVDGESIYEIMSPQAVKGLDYQLKSIVGSSGYSDSETPRLLRWLFKQKDLLSTARLATAGQFLVQASSAVPAALIMNPKGFMRAMSTLTGMERGYGKFDTLKEFLSEHGLSIQLRDYLFEKFQTEEDIAAKGLRRGIGIVGGKLEQIATAPLRKGDKFAARLVWFSAFYANGGTLNKPTRDAVLAAERAVGVLQNMSDVSFSAPMFKGDTPSRRMLIHMFFAFKSFSMNAAINTYYSAKYAINSAEARRVFASNMFMAASYHAAAVYLIKPLYGALADALFGEGGDDDEKNYNNWDYIKQNTMWDMAVGQVSPTVIDALLRYYYTEGREAVDEEFDPIMDSALFSPKTEQGAWAESLGQYGDLFNIYRDLFTWGGQNLAESMDLLEDSTDEAQTISQYKLLQSAATLIKLFPLRGDVAKLLREGVKREKAQQKPAKGAGDSEVESEEEFAPETEFYEDYYDEESVEE